MTSTTKTYSIFDQVEIVEPNGRYTDELVASMADHTFRGDRDRDWSWFTEQMAAQVLALPEAQRGEAINQLYVHHLKTTQPEVENKSKTDYIIFRIVPIVAAILIVGFAYFNPLVQFTQHIVDAITTSGGH